MKNELIDFLNNLPKKSKNEFITDGCTINEFGLTTDQRDFLGTCKQVDFNHIDNESIESTWFFDKFNCYVLFEGYYSSYNGSQFQNLYLVEPEQIMKTIYKPIKVVESTDDQLLSDIKQLFNDDENVYNCGDDGAENLKDLINYIDKCECIEDYDRDDYGAEAYRIYEIKLSSGRNLFVRLEGYYSSYNGFTLETTKIVQPKEKTVIVYE